MKSIGVLSIVVLLSTAGISQQVGVPEQHIASAEELIRTAIISGGWDGHMQKQFGRLGDAAAVAITKVFPEGDLRPSEVDSVLAVLTISFADPSLVETAADREPRAAFFVLRYLDLVASDADMKKKIAETRKYVREQFAKYEANVSTGSIAKPP